MPATLDTTSGIVYLKGGGSVTFTNVTANRFIAATSGTAGAPAFVFGQDDDGTGSGFFRPAGNLIDVALNGAAQFRFQDGSVFEVRSDTIIGWSQSTIGAGRDTELTRVAVGVVKVNNAIRVGSNAAPNTSGIGLTNDEGITFRQAGGAGNYPLIKGDSSNNILIGGSGPGVILPLHTMRPNGTTSDLGSSTDPWRTGYFGQGNYGTTSTDGLALVNNTAAAAGAQQISPRIRLTGQGWKTDATAASQAVDWVIENLPVQGTSAPTSTLLFKSQVNAGGYTTRFTLDSTGSLTVANQLISTGSVISGGDVRATGGSLIFWFGRTQMSAPADGQLKLTDNAGTDFGRLMFGGTSSSFPALKRSSAQLHVRLADDSAFGEIQALEFYTNGTFMMKSSVSWNNGAAAETGTLTNAPSAGNPTKWIPVNDNGTTRYIPAW